MTQPIHIIGAGLAGSEAAWQMAQAGIKVIIYEMRPQVATFAHKTGHFAELVCSNSFRSDNHNANAVGLLHWEMRAAKSLIMEMADAHAIAAGSALAVDRDRFALAVTERLSTHPNIHIKNKEVKSLTAFKNKSVLVATGPLTSPALAESIIAKTGRDQLAFYDAITPVVYADSIDMLKAWMQSRYDKGETHAQRTAYINCPMDKNQYNAFIDAILAAQTNDFKDWEKQPPYFEGCLPIEIMASRGRETPRFGPMKPVGLTNLHQPHKKPYAVVQLRRDNKLGTFAA